VEPRADILEFMVTTAPAPENHTVKENKGTGVKSQTFRALNNNGKAIPMSVSRFRDKEQLHLTGTTEYASPHIFT
jgi:hypothetical protein